jgi:hypothetical protein
MALHSGARCNNIVGKLLATSASTLGLPSNFHLTTTLSLEIPASSGLRAWRQGLGISFAISIYRAIRLLFLGANGQPIFVNTAFNRHLGAHLSNLGRSRMTQGPPLRLQPPPTPPEAAPVPSPDP